MYIMTANVSMDEPLFSVVNTDLFDKRFFHYVLLSGFFFFLNEELSPP